MVNLYMAVDDDLSCVESKKLNSSFNFVENIMGGQRFVDCVRR